MINGKMYLRKAKMEDVDLLFGWVNDKSVRENSFDGHLISYDEHVSWFKRMMDDPDQVQYILMLDDIPVGQIRLCCDKDIAVISYSIAQSQRGKGYGSDIIKLVTEKIKEDRLDIKKVVGRVKPNNIASVKCFISNGFEESFSQFEYELK